jgi:hypothetical protein
VRLHERTPLSEGTLRRGGSYNPPGLVVKQLFGSIILQFLRAHFARGCSWIETLHAEPQVGKALNKERPRVCQGEKTRGRGLLHEDRSVISSTSAHCRPTAQENMSLGIYEKAFGQITDCAILFLPNARD